MIRAVLVSVLAGALASPAAAADLLYKRRPAELETLSRFDGQPYWRVLGACAGMHGVLVNRHQASDPARAAATKAQALQYMNAALGRAQADRALNRSSALDMVTPAVNEGRALGAAVLQHRPGPYTPEQIVDGMCFPVLERHSRTAR